MSGSIVVRRSLGRRLKALRLAAGKTIADAAAAGIASKAKLFRIEAGQGAIKMADVRTLCWLYGADAETTEILAEMALRTDKDGWWENYFDIMPSWLASYIELEAAASAVRVYDPELVYGPLQTEGYQRAIYATANATSVTKRLELRLQRRRNAFERDPPLKVQAVFGAGVLQRQVGGPAVMAEQVEHLLASAREPHLEILVVPWAAGAHPAMAGPQIVLHFAEADHPDVAYLETIAGARYIEKPETVNLVRDAFERTLDQAVTLEEYLK